MRDNWTAFNIRALRYRDAPTPLPNAKNSLTMDLTKPNSIWQRQQFSSDELRLLDANRVQFMAAIEGDAITGRCAMHVEGDMFSVIDVIKAHLKNPYACGWAHSEVAIIGEYNGHPLYVSIEQERGRPRRRKVMEHGVHEFVVCPTGHPDAVNGLIDTITAQLGRQNHAQIRWWYSGNGQAQYQTLYLPPTTHALHPEFYPDLGDPDLFIKNYLDSDSAILLLAGPPGTGKTSLLRHMVTAHKLTAHVIYDEKLMERDSVFQTFLFEDDSDIMIIEDADTILSAREHDQNKLMSRFLNVADGLIKLPNKKLVFTTNISDFNKVDPALTRPGRCYAVVHTRTLNLDEAQTAARKANLSIPVDRREYTLAELFNPEMKQPQMRRIGLVP